MNNISEYIQPTISEDTTMIGSGYDKTGGAIGDRLAKLNLFNIIIIGMGVIVIVIIIFKLMTVFSYKKVVCETFEPPQQVSEAPIVEDFDPLTKCGWEVVISPTCPYCIRQKAILNEYFPKFNSFYTDRPVEAVPTWINTKTGQKVPGMQTVESLQRMAAC